MNLWLNKRPQVDSKGGREGKSIKWLDPGLEFGWEITGSCRRDEPHSERSERSQIQTLDRLHREELTSAFKDALFSFFVLFAREK